MELCRLTSWGATDRVHAAGHAPRGAGVRQAEELPFMEEAGRGAGTQQAMTAAPLSAAVRALKVRSMLIRP